MNFKKRILVAPLNWGLGHATRCIPIIKALMVEQFEPVIACDGASLNLLKKEFPGLTYIELPSYNITYSKHGFLLQWQLFKSIPRLLKVIREEHKQTQNIIQTHQIEGLISDNRFGFHHNKVPSVFITHQLNIQTGFELTNSIARWLQYRYIKKFNSLWIPDIEGNNNYAGLLSNPKVKPTMPIWYLGALSRLSPSIEKTTYEPIQFLGIVSGPEPQRTILEKGLIKALKDRKEKSLIVLGKPEIDTNETMGNLSVHSHMNATELNTAITQSELIICRPGYSTVMDLAKLEKKAFFIPTPGQTEQEYLAANFKQNGICYSQKQADFDFEKAITESKKYSGFVALKQTTTNWEELFCLF